MQGLCGGDGPAGAAPASTTMQGLMAATGMWGLHVVAATGVGGRVEAEGLDCRLRNGLASGLLIFFNLCIVWCRLL